MFKIQGATTVARGAADVTRFLADPANDAKWQRDIVALNRLDGTPGAVGAKYERVQLVMGRNIKTATELVAVEPGKRVAFQGKGKVIELGVEYRLAAEGQATKVEMRLEGEMLGFASMFEGAAAEALEKFVPESLAKLKTVLESGG